MCEVCVTLDSVVYAVSQVANPNSPYTLWVKTHFNNLRNNKKKKANKK